MVSNAIYGISHFVSPLMGYICHLNTVEERQN